MPADIHTGVLFRLGLSESNLRRKPVWCFRGVKKASDDGHRFRHAAARHPSVHDNRGQCVKEDAAVTCQWTQDVDNANRSSAKHSSPSKKADVVEHPQVFRRAGLLHS